MSKLQMIEIPKITYQAQSKTPQATTLVSRHLSKINEDIEKLNVVIREYNDSTEIERKKILLKRIRDHAKRVQDRYPGDVITLLKEFQEQFQKNLQKILHEQSGVLKADATVSTLTPPNFSDILSAMSYDKLSVFMHLLSHGAGLNQYMLENLYDAQDISTEARDYRTFYQAHTITFLGGSNAQNFKLERRDTNESSVIKIEYRFDMPKEVERKLRIGTLKGTITSVYAERIATFNHKNLGVITCSILETDLLPVNLEDYMIKQKTPEKKINAVLDIYQQMATLFEKLQKNNAAFPDAKNSNWLVDSTGKLQIADTKSFIRTENDYYNRQEMIKQGYYIISTEAINPPEMFDPKAISIEPLHCYLLGMNLYQALTDTPLSRITPLNFNHPIFRQPPGGPVFKRIIKEATNTDSTKRITLAEFRQNLEEIKIQQAEIDSLKKSNLEKLGELRALKPEIASNMKELINNIQMEMNLSKLKSYHDHITNELQFIEEVNICHENIKAIQKYSTTEEIRKLAEEFSLAHQLYSRWLARLPVDSEFRNSPEREFIVDGFQQFCTTVSLIKINIEDQSMDEASIAFRLESIQLAKHEIRELIKSAKTSPYHSKYITRIERLYQATIGQFSSPTDMKEKTQMFKEALQKQNQNQTPEEEHIKQKNIGKS